MGAQGPGEKLSLFHAGTKSSGGTPRGSSGCLCWFVAAEAPQEVPGAQTEWRTHARKHRISSLGLGLRRLQDPPHSVLGLPRHKAQVQPGTAGCLPVPLALHRIHTHSTGGKDSLCTARQAGVLCPSNTANQVCSKGRAELQAGPELRGCPVSAGRGRSSRQDLPGSVGSSTKRLCGSRHRS